MSHNFTKMTDIADKYNALSLRERSITGALVFVVIFIAWNEFVWSAQGENQKKIQQQLIVMQTQIDTLGLQIGALTANKKRDPDAREKQQLQQLQVVETRLDEQLQKTMRGLIKPSQMAKVLEAVLTRQTDLKLYRVANLPTEDLISVTRAQGDAETSHTGVYKHGLQIEFRGSYLGMLDYLKALDELPWEFYWDSLALNVEQYPKSHITIQVHTLSLAEGWIGV